jgi:hypothetical protein
MENKEMRTRSPEQEVAARFLRHCLGKRLPPAALEWLSQKCSQVIGNPSPTILYPAFSAAPRMVGKTPLQLSETELTEAAEVWSLWHPQGWTADQAARSLLLLSYNARDEQAYVAAIEKLFSTADVRELIALHQSLPLLPHPQRYRRHAMEAVRSNMVSVFHAIALGNPYPFEWFDEPAWNQMVLKVTFIGSALEEVIGLEARANTTLARMLCDLARERRAAGRSFPDQAWPLIAPFIHKGLAEDLLAAPEHNGSAHAPALSVAMAQPKKEKN